MRSARALTETALLSALLFTAGLLRLPSPVPGSEFQLSAPLAVALCGVFGFRIYFAAGILVTALSLLTGAAAAPHALVALTFRLAVGAVYGLLGEGRLFYLFAGPAGTLAARAVLADVLGGGFPALVLAALPGMAFNAAAALPLARLLRRGRAAVPVGSARQM